MYSRKIPFFNIPLIWIDAEVFSMPKKAIIGCIVHELCHVANWNETNERVIDQMVIYKGYGKHLYAFMKYHDKKYRKYKKRDGLTKKEIKKEIRS